VIKVERPGEGDDTRAWGPPWFSDAAERMSACYLCANRGKRSVAIDIASSDGQRQIRQLVREADVVIENYKVGQLARDGLDAAPLRASNPRLVVYCSITGYGQTGPDAARAGYDFAIQAAGGLMSITGEREGTPGSGPPKVGVAVLDVMTGVCATSAILAALHARERNGHGATIDMALLDAQAAMLANQASNHLVGGTAPRRLGNAHANIVPYPVFATADGHIVPAVGNDAQFAKFCDLAGRPAVARDARFATNAARVARRGEPVPMIAGWMLARTTGDWARALDACNVPCAPIRGIAQVFAGEQVRARGLRLDLADARGRAVPGDTSPVVFDGQRAAARHRVQVASISPSFAAPVSRHWLSRQLTKPSRPCA